MVLAGFLGFLAPAKPDAMLPIGLLGAHGVRVCVQPGDNAIILQHVAAVLGIANQLVATGKAVAAMEASALRQAVATTDLFEQLAPMQMPRIIKTMRAAGHTVGTMGAGIKALAALRVPDVSISVELAADILMHAAGIILLENALLVLVHGILVRRRVYANAKQTIKKPIASNFGNAFSVLVASIFYSFHSMLAIQYLVQNQL